MILSLVSLGVFNFLFMWFASFGVSIADSGYDCYGYYDYDGNISNSSAQISNDNITIHSAPGNEVIALGPPETCEQAS